MRYQHQFLMSDITYSVSRRIGGLAMELVNGHESFLALTSRGALSILDASFKFANGAKSFWWNLMSSSAVIGVIAGLTSASVHASEKGFAFEVGEGCRELASEVGLVSERKRYRRSSRSTPCLAACASLHRARGQFGVFKFGRGCDVACRGESRADFPEVSLKLLDPSEWKLAAYGGFFREENISSRSTFHLVCCSICRESLSAGAPPDLSDNLALVLALPRMLKQHLHYLQSCVESSRLASGQVSSYRSGGYRQS